MKRLFSLVFMLFSFSFFSVFATNQELRPKVSVVVPVYGVEKWLRECMDNLVNQTLKEIEIICVDDGSPDNCGAILDEYAKKDSRVKVIHQENAGVQKARNAGLDIATGEYIALLDSDDYVDIHTYETAYNLAKKDNVDILNFKARIFDDGKDDHINNIDFSDGPVVSAEEYIQNNYRCWVWDNLFKNEIVQKDKIRFIPGIKPADDTCFTYMALGRAKTVKSIPATFYNYRMRPCALSRMTSEDIFINSYKMFKYICDSWRSGNCLQNNEHNLITLIVRWANVWGNVRLDYAQEILDSFGSDVYNQQNVERCPSYIRETLRLFEKTVEYGKTPSIEDGVYRIVSAVDPSKELDIFGGSKENGGNLHLWDVTFNDNQKFIVTHTNSGAYVLTALHSGKALDVAYGSNEIGANIWQYEKNNSSAQKWYIVPCGDSYYKLISQCNFLAMDVFGGNAVKGTNIQCWEDNGTNAQKFKFVKVSDIDEEPISIALASDSNYAYPTIVTMTSILENKNPDTKINFYIMLSGNFEQSLKDQILSLQNKYQDCTINLIDMKDSFSKTYISRNITGASYYRLMLSSLLPDVKKVLYLDTDMIVTSDLKKLFSYNMDNYYVAGVLDGIVPCGDSIYTMQQEAAWRKGYSSYEEVIGIEDMSQYINAGLSLFNLSKMREDNIEEKLISAATTHNYDWHDQDTINVICYNKIRLLPLKYNCMIHCVYTDNANYLYSSSEIKEARKNSQVIHYTSIKPWYQPYSAPLSDLWWMYAEKTDFLKEIQEKYLFKDGTYIISSALNENKVLDINNASKENGANLQLWDKNYTNAQKFDIKYIGDRCFQLTAKCSNKSIDVSGANRNVGTNIWQYNSNNTDAQKWYIVPCGNGLYKIVSKCNNLVMDVDGAQTKNGTNIHCWDANGTNAQKFKFDMVS